MAQTVTTTTPAVIASGQEWAATTMKDPIDMSQWTDVSWWAYSVDAPSVSLSGVDQAACTATANASPTTESGSSCFTATTTSAAGNLWILETPNSVSADLHKNGTQFPIDASTYKTVAFRMRLNSGNTCTSTNGAASAFPQCTTSFLWNQTSLYDTLPVTQTGAIFTYEGWGIYFIDLTSIGYAGTPRTPWAGTIRDLRYTLQNLAGANVEIDWIRLVPNNLSPQTITWSGFGANQVDIYLDRNSTASDGNLGLVMQNNVVSLFKGDVNCVPVACPGDPLNGVPKGSGSMTFQPGALAPGNYHVVVCRTGTTTCTYSSSPFQVNDIPLLTFRSPSPEGSSDDFATTVLGDAWDMNALTDVDYYLNNTTATPSTNVGLTATTVNAVDETGASLGTVNVVQSAGSAIGDPYMYTLWYHNAPVPGRGQTKRIDANKYHILTLEAGIPNKARDINGGSVIRMLWQVQGERGAGGIPKENVSQDIIFNHRAGYNVMTKITADMKTLALEIDPGASPSTTGWLGNIESFRFDAHEFSPSTPYYVKRIKLAANEQTTSTYNIQWTYVDSVASTSPTLTLSYDTNTDPTSGLVTIVSGLNPALGLYSWDTVAGAVPNGTYYIYASYSDGLNSNGSYSRWPIVVGPLTNLTATPSLVNIITTKSGATLPFSSPAQEVTVTMSGAAVAWTATANQPWVQVTNGSGTGSGRFSVSLINPGDVIGTSSTLSATVTISAPQIGLISVVTIALRVKPAGTSDLPFGSFDTPVSSATAVSGSFAVTGWALDDIGINRVEIYRDRVLGETTPVRANGKIYIADAFFVTGARADVEQARSDHPFASRAGWGYLLLSYGLFNQGNGPFTLYAQAYDVEGNVVTLGSKSIVVSNNSASKPFGALDTPAYGETRFGQFQNFGWALTPNATPTCTVAGGSVRMAIDSGTLTPVGYGTARTDIAAAFPGYSDGSAGGGNIVVDTALLTNGTHQIGWYVVDSCNRAEGIGSRFFQVLNGGSSTVATSETVAARAAAVTSPVAEMVASVEAAPVSVQRHDRDWSDSYPNADGVRVIAVAQGERIEVQLPSLEDGTYQGARVLAGVRSSLPTGSSLDARAGVFYWEPVAGFLGQFDLEFVATRPGNQRTTLVRVVVGPAMRTAVDTPPPGESVQQPFWVSGWAVDLAATDGAGIDAVHVWAYPATGRPPVFVGFATLGDARPDVAGVYGPQALNSAYHLPVAGLRPGVYDLVVYPHRAGTNTFEGAQAVRVTMR